MKMRTTALAALCAFSLTGCALLDEAGCFPHCHRSESRASTGLVGFLYPGGATPPADDAIPELKLPLRVGLAFLPSHGNAVGLEASHREELLERIRQRFADRKFVSQIVIIPDYYLDGRTGFEGLQGVQRLYNVDVMGLVSYDQVSYRDENALSLGYLTIVGAYVLKGSSRETTTLMDLAVVDPATRSILLRAGGTDSSHGRTTAVGQAKEAREALTRGFSDAIDQLIGNFDTALTKFEKDVREGKANVRVAHRSGGGGAGSFDAVWLLFLAGLLMLRAFASRRVAIKDALACAPR